MAMKSKTFFLQSTALPSVSALRAPLRAIQVAQFQDQPPELRANYRGTQFGYYQADKPEMRSSSTIVQYIIQAPEINPMSSQVFPELKGLMFETHAKPTFSTKVTQHTSGKETRTSFWQYPTWEFDLMYDYLPNDPTHSMGETDLKTLMGFFMEMAGSFDTFFFKAPDDYHVEDAEMLIGNGSTNSFILYRQMRGFKEPIGYLTPATIALWWTVSLESHVVSGGNTIQLNHPHVLDDDNLLVTLVGFGPLTRVTGPPGNHEYSINLTTGLMTFNVAQSGGTVTTSYKASMVDADWTYLPANTIQLSTSALANEVVTASYDFYFVCRFADDQNDFDQFMDKLWEIQQLNLQSVLT